MKTRISSAAIITFALMLLVTAGGIAVHQLTGYDYPAVDGYSYELNVLGDLFEGIFLVPAGLVALVGLRRGRLWGAVLAAGLAADITYNYAMAVTGVQNLWTLVWVAKLALAGTSVALLWDSLAPPIVLGSPAAGDAGSSLPRRGRFLIAAFLAFAGLVMAAKMGQRLLASASGQAVGMTMVESGAVDWGDPTLRDAIVYFSLFVPFAVSAVWGLVAGTVWGRKSAMLCLAFIPVMVVLIIFSGPVQEYLLQGSVSGPMLSLSAMLLVMAFPAVAGLVWLGRRA